MSARTKKLSTWATAVCLASVGLVSWSVVGLKAGAILHVDPSGSNTDPMSMDPNDCLSTPCQTINYAISKSAPGDTILVATGTYNEDVTVSVSVTLQGAGIGLSTISGPIGGPGSGVTIAAAGVVIDGFTITRDGNNTTDWNNPGLNSAGLSVQGLTANVEVRNSRLYGNRTGIDINNSNGNYIHNSVIDDNRTGMIFRNQTDNTVVIENTIANNWTVGVLFLDASGGTNVPVQTALSSTFSNNNISGNWYGQVVDRQSGGSIPAPPANAKNFRGNWYGNASPAVSTANSVEPPYPGQIPVAYGGSAVPPGGQPDILGPASANLFIRPFAKVGTDTNIETTPLRGTIGFQGEFAERVREGNIVRRVESDPPNTWGFWTLFKRNAAQGAFRVGPSTPSAGFGSLEFTTTGTNDKVWIFNFDHIGTPLSSINALGYSTYRTSGDASQLPSINIEINPNGPNNGTFATLVFEPVYNPAQGGVVDNTWQTWEAYDGGAARWWSTRDLKDSSGNLVACDARGGSPSNPLCDGKYYVPWATIAAALPNAYILGGVGVNVGSGAQPMVAAVDELIIGVPTYEIHYDFDHPAPATLSLSNLLQEANGSPRPVTVTTDPLGLSGVSVTYNGSPTAPSAYGSYLVVASLTNPDYEAPNVSDTLVIVDNRTSQAITAGNISNKTTVAPSFTITAYATSQLEVTFSSTGPCTLTPLAHVPGNKNWQVSVDPIGAGPCEITMLQAGNATWAPANATRSFLITKVNQKITFPAIAAHYTGDGPFTVSASVNSPLQLVFNPTGPCSVSSPTPTGVTVSLTGATGTCSIEASQPGNGDYNAAPPLTRSFVVNQAVGLLSVGLSPTAFNACTAGAVTGRVTLNLKTPVDQVVVLTTDNTGLNVPATVTVLANQKIATFTVTAASVVSAVTGTIKATLNSVEVTGPVTINPSRILSVGLTPSSVPGGDSSMARVTLDCAAPEHGLTIAMSTTNPTRASIGTAPPVKVLQGETTVDVLVNTTTGNNTVAATVRAQAGGVTKQATLTITPTLAP